MPVCRRMLFTWTKKCLSPAMNKGIIPRRGLFSHASMFRRTLRRFILMSALTRMFSTPSLPVIRAMLRRARSVTKPQS